MKPTNRAVIHNQRRRLLRGIAGMLGVSAASQISGIGLLTANAAPLLPATHENGFRPLFDGVSLAGWHRTPRDPKRPTQGLWTVQDGVIIGGQSEPGVGSYLVSDGTFADFELDLEARADWRTDTGIYVRTNADGNTGFQVALDFRPHGALNGYYGNNTGRFHACDYCFTGVTNSANQLIALKPEKPSEPLDETQHVPLDYAPPAKDFLKIFKLNGWNHFRIRSVNALPHLTTWINGVKVAELDTAKLKLASWDPAKIDGLVGRAGHISFEVHNQPANDWLKDDRWAPGNVCRWRYISIKAL